MTPASPCLPACLPRPQALQKQYYRALYERNVGFLNKGRRGADAPSLMNLHMELRKCCNHPFLNRGVEQDVSDGEPASSS